jgi:RNA polymerase sigma-70 factor (ECF subfamily)
LVLFGSLAGTAIMLVRGSSAASFSSGPIGQAPDRGAALSNGVGTPTSRPEPLRELAAADPQDRVRGQSGTNKRGPSNDSSDEVTLDNAPPVVVKTTPEAGATEVAPDLSEIRVTFSKKMLDKSWSWSTASKNTFPKVSGDIRYLEDGRTCVLPVKLEPGKTYATWINSGRFINFKDRERRPAVPYLLVFETKR